MLRRAVAGSTFAVLLAVAAPVHAGEEAAEFSLPELPDVAVAVPLNAGDAAAPVIILPEPPRPPSASAAVLGPDAAVKSALAELLKAPLRAGPFAPAGAVQRREREAMGEFYAERNFAPLWRDGAQWSSAGRSLIARLERAGDDGLDLAATPIPAAPKDAVQAAAAEIALTEAALAYGRQASGGRVDPRQISQLITVTPETASPAEILAKVAEAGDAAGEALRSFNPQHSGYVALRRKLQELRQARLPSAREGIPAGPTLRVGMQDPRVPLIRARFGLDAELSAEPADLVYDTHVASAIADFQRANGLPASGVLTPRTIAALSGGEPARLENEIVANMERWRWLPRDLGQQRIEVNIPDFTVRVFDGETMRHEARAVVGKPDTPTPVFSHAMQFLIVNPYWSIPPSIIKKEILPKLAADPNYLHRLGYEVIQRRGVLIVRQPPGERNALGRIKFMFPNDHAVYLHDTPSRALFANDARAFSHGCVRVDQPFKLAEILLGGAWSEARLKELIGGPERTLRLPRALPIHIEYFTASVDPGGRLRLRDDIYGYSRRLKLALRLEN